MRDESQGTVDHAPAEDAHKPVGEDNDGSVLERFTYRNLI